MQDSKRLVIAVIAIGLLGLFLATAPKRWIFPKWQSRSEKQVQGLHRVAVALERYVHEHDSSLPSDLQQLYPNYLAAEPGSAGGASDIFHGIAFLGSNGISSGLLAYCISPLAGRSMAVITTNFEVKMWPSDKIPR